MDPRLRELERQAAAGDMQAQLAYARARVRAGLPIEPWQLEPLSYLFLQAANQLHDDPPGRVEGYRKVALNQHDVPYLIVGVQLHSHPTGDTDVLQLAEPELSFVTRVGALPQWTEPSSAAHHKWAWDWQPGTSPGSGQSLAGLSDYFRITAHDDVPPERFYVSPSSYPMYRNAEEWGRLVGAMGQAEEEVHLAAVEYFVSQGAVRYVIPKRDMPDRRASENWERWFAVYRQRVLVGVKNLRGARSFAEGWGVDAPFGGLYEPISQDHNSKILFPQWWAKARLMTPVGTGTRRRWKNPW